jgi:hypothetical protein
MVRTANDDGVWGQAQVPPERHHRRAWQRAGELLLEAAERNGSVDAVRRQVIFALLMDGKLDAGL